MAKQSVFPGLVLGLAILVALALLPTISVQAAPLRDDTIYVVKSGDRLVDIAARYGVTASALLRANGIVNADLIYPGQRLVIPGAPATAAPVTAAPATPASSATPTPAPVTAPPVTPAPAIAPTGAATAASVAAATAGPIYHTVALGDTVDKIARRYGVSASAIVRANGLSNPDVIYVGQKLLISDDPAATNPATQPKPAATAQPPAPIKQTTYVVQAGDTLARIAQKYSVSIPSLVQANGLGSADMIRVGQRLLIPGQGVTKYPGRATKFVASISRQRCWLYQGETILSEWVCSTGRAGSNTRPGSYKIQSKLPKAYGSTWNIWMPYWLGIYWAGASENGIHGLPWNAKTGVQVWTGYVGTPITYGCVMLDNVNAKMLYDMAYIGMPVVIKP